MTMAIRSWRRTRRFRALVRELSSMSASELAALGINPAQIGRLAFAASDI
jgi:uncharacterized protein YjiS (DUF1127 family)